MVQCMSQKLAQKRYCGGWLMSCPELEELRTRIKGLWNAGCEAALDPNVWSGRASQEGSWSWLSGLAQMYPASRNARTSPWAFFMAASL